MKNVKNVIAGIVLYNPDINRLKKNINAILPQVKKVILIDNNSNNLKNIERLIESFENVILLHNNENLGISKALNQILNYSINNKYDWFLTLDQDSIVNSEIISSYSKYINYSKVAIITSHYSDLNINNSIVKMNNTKFDFVDSCITSGALCNTKIFNKINGFDEKMFIDFVDFDVCATLMNQGYKIIKINFKGFLHEVGDLKIKNVLGIKIHIYNHSVARIYYIARNGLYFLNKHKNERNFNYKKWKKHIIKELLVIAFFEKNKIAKFKMIKKGIKDSKKMNYLGEL